jgi:hypothetical protein
MSGNCHTPWRFEKADHHRPRGLSDIVYPAGLVDEEAGWMLPKAGTDPPGGPRECGANDLPSSDFQAFSWTLRPHFIRRTAAETGPRHFHDNL